MATLKSGIQAALLQPPDAGRDRRVLENLLEDVNRLEDLCDALLLVASTRAAPGEPGIDAEDWTVEIEAVVHALQTNGGLEDGRLRFAGPEGRPGGVALHTTGSTTRRIATNLIENAIRHGGKAVRIEVRVVLSPDGARLVVEDDGPGVRPADRPRLFERFFRADRARSRRTGGAGLGLAICHALATAHGGAIHHEPVQPHGSRFVWRVTAAPRDRSHP